MVRNATACPDPQHLKQFVLGQICLSEVEDFEHHLSHCDPCIETVNSLRISDTFTDVASQAWLAKKLEADQSGDDGRLLEQMMHDAEGWSVANRPAQQTEPFGVTAGKSAEVQNLLREPRETGDLGAVAHFRLVELIGAGSTGVVYRGIDTKLDRDVVIKILRSSLGEAARQRFVTEAKTTAAIEHANVVTIYEVGSDGPLSYIAMQWIPGKTLEQCLAQCESLPLERTKKLAIEIASGLAAAHQQGLIHRDIKPANIWIPENDGPAKILDFGLVRVNDEDPQLTCTGMIAGTPCFMSPEQSRGDTLDARSDLFSLGCLIYQCLTGQLPFRGDNALATLRSIQQVHPTHPRELDPTIDSDMSDLTMCLLAKSPARRPESAQILVASLQTDSSHCPFELVSESHSKQSTDPLRRTRGGFWKLVAALLIGIGVTSFGFAYGQQIIRIATNQGEIEIETTVDDVKIEVSRAGELVKVIDLTTENKIEISAGEYQLSPVGDENSISIDKNRLTLSRGEKEIVKITRTESQPNDAALVGRQVNKSAVAQEAVFEPITNSALLNSKQATATGTEQNRQGDPVYKEKTYAEWLRIARTDRDATSLILACKGIANLASENQVPEVLDVAVQINRRGPGVCSNDERKTFYDVVSQIFNRQPTVTRLNLFAEELRNGNRESRRYFTRSGFSFNQKQLEQYSNAVDDFLAALSEYRNADPSEHDSRTSYSIRRIGTILLPYVENEDDRLRNLSRFEAWGLEGNDNVKQIVSDFMQNLYTYENYSASSDWIAKHFASEEVVKQYSTSLQEFADAVVDYSSDNPDSELWSKGLSRAYAFCFALPEVKRPQLEYIEFCRRVLPVMAKNKYKSRLVQPLGNYWGHMPDDALPELRNGEPTLVAGFKGESLQGEFELGRGTVFKFNSIGFKHPDMLAAFTSRFGEHRDYSRLKIEPHAETGQFTVSIDMEGLKSDSQLLNRAIRNIDRDLTDLKLIKAEK